MSEPLASQPLRKCACTFDRTAVLVTESSLRKEQHLIFRLILANCRAVVLGVPSGQGGGTKQVETHFQQEEVGDQTRQGKAN